jgi:hypothetical protein
VPCLNGIRFNGGGVFVHFVGDVQIGIPSKEVEAPVWAGAMGHDVT